jgi:hypothetical protein
VDDEDFLMQHMVGLYVRTDGQEDFAKTFQLFSNMALDVGEDHEHVTLSSHQMLDSEPDGYEYEEVRYNEQTMVKVRDAIRVEGLKERVVDDIVNRLQNAGILFRERVPVR